MKNVNHNNSLKSSSILYSGLISSLIFCACESKQSIPAQKENTSTVIIETNDSIYGDTLNYAYYYLVIADSGKSYGVLEKQMHSIHQATKLEIDLMGRSYNAQKDLICLADDDPDEIYRGDYFPRRYPTASMSIEYFDFFSQKSSDKNMILLTGIFETKEEAEKQREHILSAAPRAFIVHTPVYVGCMH